jgi:hypothetical protein
MINRTILQVAVACVVASTSAFAASPSTEPLHAAPQTTDQNTNAGWSAQKMQAHFENRMSMLKTHGEFVLTEMLKL